MKLLKEIKTYVSKDGNKILYNQLYLVTDYKKFAVKPCFANDKILLNYLAEKSVDYDEELKKIKNK